MNPPRRRKRGGTLCGESSITPALPHERTFPPRSLRFPEFLDGAGGPPPWVYEPTGHGLSLNAAKLTRSVLLTGSTGSGKGPTPSHQGQ